VGGQAGKKSKSLFLEDLCAADQKKKWGKGLLNWKKKKAAAPAEDPPPPVHLKRQGETKGTPKARARKGNPKPKLKKGSSHRPKKNKWTRREHAEEKPKELLDKRVKAENEKAGGWKTPGKKKRVLSWGTSGKGARSGWRK